MGSVININGAGKERNQLTRGIVLALRELVAQKDTDSYTQDLAAFIVLALESISKTIDSSVEAWEKRGYWVKADRFRMEWAWSSRLAQMMRKALMEEDWSQVALAVAQVAEKLKTVKVPQRHHLGSPWVGAWEQLHKS